MKAASETAGDLLHFNKGSNFKEVAQMAQLIGAQYSSYNDMECVRLKSGLLNMWNQGNATGRVRLVDFYRLGMDSEWSLNEKADYLRTLGALDESVEGTPTVIVPNYLTARPNCLQSTQLYSVCCRNECEDLLGHLEKTLGEPSASPEQIVELISKLPSQT